MRGKKTTLRSGKTGMTSGSLTFPTSAGPPARRVLESQAPDARPRSDAVDPGLNGREGRLQLDAEAPEHHDPGRERSIGEGELLANEVFMPGERVPRVIDAMHERLPG